MFLLFKRLKKLTVQIINNQSWQSRAAHHTYTSVKPRKSRWCKNICFLFAWSIEAVSSDQHLSFVAVCERWKEEEEVSGGAAQPTSSSLIRGVWDKSCLWNWHLIVKHRGNQEPSQSWTFGLFTQRVITGEKVMKTRVQSESVKTINNQQSTISCSSLLFCCISSSFMWSIVWIYDGRCATAVISVCLTELRWPAPVSIYFNIDEKLHSCEDGKWRWLITSCTMMWNETLPVPWVGVVTRSCQ